MYISINSNSYYTFGGAGEEIHRGEVYSLAEKSFLPLLENQNKINPSYLLTAVTCPDTLAPSLSQLLCAAYPQYFEKAFTIDMIQGCAGGISALLAGNHLALHLQKPVLVIAADAANRSVSPSSSYKQLFGNGAAAFYISPQKKKGIRLLHSMSRQYPELRDVVTIQLGHDAQFIFDSVPELAADPRKYLGLQMNNKLAIKLLYKTNGFYEEFCRTASKPDVMIFHQVNPQIVGLLKKHFAEKDIILFDFTEKTGNCGAASAGIVLDLVKEEIKGKKVFICGFGTGGIITAGLWQF